MRRLLCIFLVLFSMPTWAAVVYNWETVNSNGYTDYAGNPIKFNGRLLVDDAAWLKGQVSYQINELPGYQFAPADPDSSIIRIDFWAGYIHQLFVDFRWGAPGIYKAHIDLKLGALATGWITVHDSVTDFAMGSGSSFLWGISHFNSDAGPPCGGTWSSDPKYCEGVTGLWVLDISTIPNRVPEPGTITLTTIGAAFAIVTRRYRIKSKNISSVAGLIR